LRRVFRRLAWLLFLVRRENAMDRARPVEPSSPTPGNSTLETRNLSHFYEPLLTPFKRSEIAHRSLGESLRIALLFAVQVAICGFVLWRLYTWFGYHGYGWALVSAVLVLQPGMDQSYATALVRVVANIIGASVGLLAAYVLGFGVGQVLAAVAIISLICEPLRLDLGLRSACVAAIIVILGSSERAQLVASGLERMVAVIAGCVLALGVQGTIERVMPWWGWVARRRGRVDGGQAIHPGDVTGE
jgi:hypothetical protein